VLRTAIAERVVAHTPATPEAAKAAMAVDGNMSPTVPKGPSRGLQGTPARYPNPS